MEETVVDATNGISIEAAIERHIEDLAELERIQEIADTSYERFQVISVDLPLRDAPNSNYEPLGAGELDAVDVLSRSRSSPLREHDLFELLRLELRVLDA